MTQHLRILYAEDNAFDAEQMVAHLGEHAPDITLDVVGNDRPGIVHDVSSALSARGVSIERMSTQTTDAAMAGGRLFEASITVVVGPDVEVDDLAAEQLVPNRSAHHPGLLSGEDLLSELTHRAPPGARESGPTRSGTRARR